MSPSTRFDPDALASLESERDFLLRSISDLDAERAAGNLDDERYQALKDDYTARAAAVLRSIEEGRDARPTPPPAPRKRKLLTGGGVLAFVLVAALALAAAAGKRHDGQTISGNAQSGGGAPSSGGAAPGSEAADPARRAALERQVKEHPDDAAAHLVYARYLLEAGEPTEAVKEYVTSAKIDPKNPEANAYAGWVLFLAAQSANADPATATELIDRALTRLDAAVDSADDYPDAHFFRGMVQFRGKNNPKAAVPDFERYLALVPDGPLNVQVKLVLDQARQQGG
ncbi:MAG TPA: tetratricopeptide repeat protein [Acidimicrobiia bacterium]|nr:tetratricopeptide repeat protein [Acidimicrobiia bacterium]